MIKRIIFEGLDESGKSIFSKMLYDLLKKEHSDFCYLISEPHSSIPIKEYIKINTREAIRDHIKFNPNLSNEFKDILYVLDREILYQYLKDSNSDLHEKLFISDRSFISNIAYQSTFTSQSMDDIISTNIKLIQKYQIPTDVIFYIERDNEFKNIKLKEEDVLTKDILHNFKQIKNTYNHLLKEKRLLDYDIFKDTKIYHIKNNHSLDSTLSMIKECLVHSSILTPIVKNYFHSKNKQKISEWISNKNTLHLV